MSYRKTALSAAIVMCLSVTAHAQDAAPTQAAAAGDATELDKVVVTGIRASLQKSLETKRNADAIVDVITAEDVGKFPATNVAEAMTIIPGVAIDRAFGQGEKVSILGTDPALNRTLLNGQSVASGDWNMSEFPTRTFNYSLLAPQLVGKVEVFKSPEARLEEGSIGGTVMVSTRKPLDLDRDIVIAGQVGFNRNDRVEHTDPSASLLFGWKNKADNFGVIVSVQKDDENIRRDGIESYNIVRASAYRPSIANGNCTGACADTINANPNAIGPNSTAAHFFEQERQRKTYTLSLQARPVEQLDIEFNAFKIDASYDHMAQPMFLNQGNAGNSLDKLTDLTIENGVITRGTMRNGLAIFDIQNRRATTKSKTYDLKATWNDERWFASTQLGSTKADAGPKQVFGEFLARTDYSWDISGSPGRPGSVTFHGANPFNTPELFTIQGWGGNVVEKPTVDKEKYGQLDFGIKLNSPLYLLRFGYKQRDHHTSQIQRGVGLNTALSPSAAMFNPRKLPGNYLSGFSGYGALKDRFTVDGWAIYDWAMSGAWLPPGTPMPELSSFSANEFARNTWSIDEDTQAAYVQADFSFDRLRGNIGVRYVRTEVTSGAFECNTGQANCVAGLAPSQYASAYTAVSRKNKFNNVLPNLNLIYDLNDEMVLRFSAAKTMARPNYTDLSSYIWLSDQSLTGGGGNPDLDPYKSTNLDLSAEWYFAENAILAASVFYRDIEDYVLQVTKPEVHYNQNLDRMDTFLVARPQNAGNAKVKGVGLAYQQDIGAGFGILANYTFSDGEADGGRPLPFNSEHQFNISPYFERGDWSARVTYGWRDKYFTRAIGGVDTWTRQYASLDASVGYRVNESLSLQLNGMNLLDETYHSYIGTEKLTNGAYKTGRRFLLTMRYDF